MQIDKDESASVLRISGALRINQVDELHTALRDLFFTASRPVIDLTQVNECDTAALQLLCSARHTAERLTRSFEMVGVSDAIRDASVALGLSLTEAPKTQGGEPEGLVDAGPSIRGVEDAI